MTDTEDATDVAQIEPTAPLTVLQAIVAVRAAVGAVRKGETNDAKGAGYKFRGIDAVVNATAAALIEHGVNIVPEAVLSVEQLDVKSGSRRTDMQATRLVIRYRIYGPRGDSIAVEASGEAYDSGDKATPKASSVAWRTALLQTLYLPTDDPDPDSFHYDRNAPAAEPAPESDLLGDAMDRAWNATNGYGSDADRRRLCEDKLAALDPPATVGNATAAAWQMIAIELELNGYTPQTPAADEPPAEEAPAEPTAEAGPGFPMSTETF